MTLDHYLTSKSNMASNMATSTTVITAFHHSNVMILSVYSRVYGCKEDIKTTLDITELLNRCELEFMTFSCPLSSSNAQTSLSIE